MMFVLTGDLHRLEHLVFDPKIEADDKTGRALLDKILPWQNRITLEPWSTDSRRCFVQWAGPEVKDLSELLSESTKSWVQREELIGALLPSWPKGLADLYESLSSESFHAEFESVRDFLGLLATCRGEPLLARKISENKLSDWEPFLRFPADVLSTEEWSETVEAAGERSKGSGSGSRDLRALRSLRPLPPAREDWRRELRREWSSRREGRSVAGKGSVSEPYGHEAQQRASELEIAAHARSGDTSGRDPLRHGELWVAPLRDAEEAVQPFWAELLLDFSFSEELDNNPARSARNRVSFFNGWQPVASRLAQAQFRVNFGFDTVREFFEDYEEIDLHSLLFWVSLQNDRHRLLTEAEIGWPTFLNALRGERDALMPDRLSELLIDIRGVRGGIPAIGAVETLALVPDQIWAMVLLTDALQRCPWAAFSARPGLEVATYLGLAGAFVRSAYAFALVAAGRLQRGKLSEVQREFIDVIDNRDSGELRRLSENDLLDRLEALFADDLPLGRRREPDALSKAARSFCALTPYRALADLVRVQRFS